MLLKRAWGVGVAMTEKEVIRFAEIGIEATNFAAVQINAIEYKRTNFEMLRMNLERKIKVYAQSKGLNPKLYEGKIK